ncbi:hypothetical protein FNV43_RR06116 [Rhamnella rubrinervis]|uniref:Uncharacterized protein n=1 Tax=Rhamnella rubrinervis TaxID=2594499 RepID=A0A8K0ML65_9ROSA|nr:hypothetical protein FNV43_RR06116 [Rhamnella rubrinervis]
MGTVCSRNKEASAQEKKQKDEAKPRPPESQPTVEGKQGDNEGGLGQAVKKTPAQDHKYWIDKNTNNCFMVYPKDMYICWVNDSRYFKWYTVKEISDESVEVAELLSVCWLEVTGNIDSAMLTPGTTYEVAFVIMVKENSSGLQYPIKLTLSLPDGSTQEHKVILLKKATGQWIKIPVGQFKTPLQIDGNIGFSFTELDSGQWKDGIIFRGVRIQPIKEQLSVV